MSSLQRFPVQGIRTLEDVIKWINEYEPAVATALESLTFDDNFSGDEIAFTSSATPDAENAVTHSLGRVPSGFSVTSLNKAATVYKGATAWTATTVYLKVNVATTAVTGHVF